MFCSKCGKESPEGANNCSNCGAPLAGGGVTIGGGRLLKSVASKTVDTTKSVGGKAVDVGKDVGHKGVDVGKDVGHKAVDVTKDTAAKAKKKLF